MVSAIEVERYKPANRRAWDAFVGKSKNGVFLFDRGYLEYHADRFDDHSLMINRGGSLLAVVPANRVGDVVQSHGGLTFGGVVSDRSMSTPLMVGVFDALVAHLRDEGVSTLVYKRVPHIYHAIPADEDLYALFRQGAVLVRRDASSTIDTRERIGFNKGRRYSIGKAEESGVEVSSSDDYVGFMKVEADLLQEKYKKKPTHTAEEMQQLASRFPDNIKLFVSTLKGQLLGGVIVYESPHVAHTQYIASTKEGRRLHAVDLVLHHLIEREFRGKRYFDFGISTENAGQYLNEGLVEFKESFGATAVAYDTYELKVGN